MKVTRKAALLLPLILLLSTPRVFSQEAPLFALQWTDRGGAPFKYQTPMVSGGSWIQETLATPEGRRGRRITWPHNNIWLNANDRCRDPQGRLGHLSSTPTGGSMYRGGTGKDGKPSGFSCPWLDGWIEETRQKTQEDVDALLAAGGTMDYLIFDVESKMDWLKINSAWGDAIMADPRWPAAQRTLDSLKRIATGDPTATFTFKGGRSVDGEAWNAYMWQQQARALTEGIFKVYQAAFPNIKGSNYEHHGRRPEDTTLETYGWQFYQTAVTGTHSSDYYYGWIIQAKDVNLGVRKMGEDSDWLIFVFEQRKARSSVGAGYPIQPWIAFSGTDFSDWRTDARAPQEHTPNPYWEENIRHLLLLEADPLLYWNSRTYKDDNYSTVALDGLVENILEEVNSRIGTASPRYTVSPEQINWFSGPANDAGRESRLPNGSGVVATGLRHGGQVTYRIAVERITNEPQDWEEVTVRVLQDGVDTGERVVVPAGETGAYYTTAFREGLSFDFEPTPVRNLLASADLTSGAWVRSGTDAAYPPADAAMCPVEDIPVARLYDKATISFMSSPVAMKRGQMYTFSVYLRGLSGSTSGGVRIDDVNGQQLATQGGYNRVDDGWARFTVTFRATTDQVIPVISAYRQLACAPALHEGVLPGRITAETEPYEPGPPSDDRIEQKISLRPGVNMVAFHVDPGNVSPDSILGGHPAVTLIKNPEDEVYSTRFSIRDIKVWDALQAYRVMAEDSVEITLRGRPLNMLWMDLEEGWNLVPYARSSPADIAVVLADYPGVLRVEDDRGSVYEPEGENVTLHSFEPGKAYRIYAKSAVRVTFPD